MKMIGRIIIILTVFIVLSGLMVVAVNASGSSTPDFGGPRLQIRQGGGGDQFRPGGDQNRFGRGDRGGGSSRWVFGLIKNVGLIAILVSVIVWPKSVAKKRKRQTGIKSANGQ